MNSTITKPVVQAIFAFTIVLATLGCANAQEIKTTKIGDVEVSRYKGLALDTKSFGGTITGANTLIKMKDPRNGSDIEMHADTIELKNLNSPTKGNVELISNVRFKVNQVLKDGTRTLEGTCKKGIYNRETNQLTLKEDVDLKLTDPALVGQGILKSNVATINMAVSPYLFTIEGDPKATELRFQPKARPNAKGELPDEDKQIGVLRLINFRTARYSTGLATTVQGNPVVITTSNVSGKTNGNLKASRINVVYEPERITKQTEKKSIEVRQIDMEGNVQFFATRPTARKFKDDDGKEQIARGTEKIDGSADKGVYENEGGKVTLSGDVKATLTDTLALQEPAKIVAAKLIVPTSNTGQYHIYGAENMARIEFSPKEPPAKPKKPAPQNEDAQKKQEETPYVFVIGKAVISNFAYCHLVPSEKLEMTALKNRRLRVLTSDTKSGSASSLECTGITFQFDTKGGVQKSSTQGEVDFKLQQIAKMPKEGEIPAQVMIQSLEGRANRVLYVNAEAQEAITLEGPFNTKIIEPVSLEGPAVAVGQKGDTFAFNLLERKFIISSPTETATLDFKPKNRPSKQKNSEK